MLASAAIPNKTWQKTIETGWFFRAKPFLSKNPFDSTTSSRCKSTQTKWHWLSLQFLDKDSNPKAERPAGGCDSPKRCSCAQISWNEEKKQQSKQKKYNSQLFQKNTKWKYYQKTEFGISHANRDDCITITESDICYLTKIKIKTTAFSSFVSMSVCTVPSTQRLCLHSNKKVFFGEESGLSWVQIKGGVGSI